MENAIEKYKSKISAAIDTAYNLQDNPYEMAIKLPYWMLTNFEKTRISSENKILLNELVDNESNILCINCRDDRGAALLSAIYNNQYNSCFLVEDFGKPLYSDSLQKAFEINCIICDTDILSFKLYEKPQYSLNEEEKEEIKDINLYMYSGKRSIQDLGKMFLYYYDNLSDIFIFYMNNVYNSHVGENLHLAIQKANLEIMLETVLGAENHVNKKNPSDFFDWDHGTVLMVLKKKNELN